MTLPSFDTVNSLLRYDPKGGTLYWRVNRGRTAKEGSLAGHFMKNGYIQIGIGGKLYYAHRIAHLLMTGQWPERNPEHENRDKLDNVWENIKDLAPNQSCNGGNNGLSRHNTSGLKGVCWHSRAKKWMAQIKVFRRHYYLGLFDDPRQAGLTYDAAAKLAWGPRFSCLNFPSEESEFVSLPIKFLNAMGDKI